MCNVIFFKTSHISFASQNNKLSYSSPTITSVAGVGVAGVAGVVARQRQQ